MGLLDGLGQEPDAGEAHIPAVKFGVGAGPQFFVGAQAFVGYGAAVGEGRGVEGGEFLGHPAHADAEYQAALRKDVQGGQYFGGQDGRAVGNNHHAGDEADVLGDAGEVGEQG